MNHYTLVSYGKNLHKTSCITTYFTFLLKNDTFYAYFAGVNNSPVKLDFLF